MKVQVSSVNTFDNDQGNLRGWSKHGPAQANLFLDLPHTVGSNFYFWIHSRCLIKHGERGMPMSLSFKWQSKLLLFWKLFLKIQLNSKFHETWFIISTMKSTSTHIKESNWVTIQFCKRKCYKHNNSLLHIRDLEIFWAWQNSIKLKLVSSIWLGFVPN
jgi:hypothetical protein